METKTPAAKMGLHPGMRAYFMQAPADVLPALHLPPLEVPGQLEGTFDYIHFFVRRQDEIPAQLPFLKPHLREQGALWISWPKAGQLGTDLRLPDVIRLGYDQGLVESKSISLTPVWSALKFTWPKKGKVYNNSYGKL